MEEAIQQMDPPHDANFGQVEEEPPSVQQADGPIEGAAPQRYAGNHFSLAELRAREGPKTAAVPGDSDEVKDGLPKVAAPTKVEDTAKVESGGAGAAVKEPGTAKAEANEANPAKASAEAEAAAGQLVKSGALKALPKGTSGDSADQSKAEKEAEIADAANHVRPMPAPHPIPHIAADEADSPPPATWAERVAAGEKAAPEILQKDGGEPAPRRQKGRLPPLVGPNAAAQMERSRVLKAPDAPLGQEVFPAKKPELILPAAKKPELIIDPVPEPVRKARIVDDIREQLNHWSKDSDKRAKLLMRLLEDEEEDVAEGGKIDPRPLLEVPQGEPEQPTGLHQQHHGHHHKKHHKHQKHHKHHHH